MEKFFGAIRNTGLRRSSDRWLAGVCAGIADRLGVEPTAIRMIVLVLALFPGPAPALYLWAWLLLPDPSGKIVLQTWIQNKSL